MIKPEPPRIEENQEYPDVINRCIRKINDYFKNRFGTCPNCNASFEKIRKNKKFCSENCQQAALMRKVRSKNQSRRTK